MSKTNENANPTTDQSTNDADATAAKLLRKLQPLWQKHKTRGLEVRHQTGRQLNVSLGKPGTRQKYGCEVVRRVSGELGLNKSEVSRMRRFAEMFESVEQLFELHPTVRTWSAVKPLLVQRPSNGSPDDGDETPALQLSRVENQLRTILKCVETGHDSLSVEDRKALAQGLSQFASATIQSLGYQIQIDISGTESS